MASLMLHTDVSSDSEMCWDIQVKGYDMGLFVIFVGAVPLERQFEACIVRSWNSEVLSQTTATGDSLQSQRICKCCSIADRGSPSAL